MSRAIDISAFGAPSGVHTLDANVVRKLADACASAAAGFEVCRKRTADEGIANLAAACAKEHADLAHEIDTLATSLGAPARRKTTCARVRWEWLASSATVLDGSPEARLVNECLRIVVDACAAGAADDSRVESQLALVVARARRLARRIDRRPARLGILAPVAG